MWHKHGQEANAIALCRPKSETQKAPILTTRRVSALREQQELRIKRSPDLCTAFTRDLSAWTARLTYVRDKVVAGEWDTGARTDAIRERPLHSVGLVRSSVVLQRYRLDGESCRQSACGPC
eukprot:7327941-Prymnesium_polylepis.2